MQLAGGTPLSTATSTNAVPSKSHGRIGTSTGFGFEIPPIGNSNPSPTPPTARPIIVRLGAVNEVVFEFDTDGLLNNTGATRGAAAPAMPHLNQVINALVIAIGGSGLGLAPVNAGFGRIYLGGDNTYSLDLTNSNATQIGLAGDEPTISD